MYFNFIIVWRTDASVINIIIINIMLRSHPVSTRFPRSGVYPAKLSMSKLGPRSTATILLYIYSSGETGYFHYKDTFMEYSLLYC